MTCTAAACMGRGGAGSNLEQTHAAFYISLTFYILLPGSAGSMASGGGGGSIRRVYPSEQASQSIATSMSKKLRNRPNSATTCYTICIWEAVSREPMAKILPKIRRFIANGFLSRVGFWATGPCCSQHRLAQPCLVRAGSPLEMIKGASDILDRGQSGIRYLPTSGRAGFGC